LKEDYKKKPKNVVWNAAGFSNQDSIGAMGRREMGKKKGKKVVNVYLHLANT
jgi:hypothetical protein